MAELRWTLQAVDDLEAITDLIAADSTHYANLFAMNVLEAVERVADFPNSGRVVPELNDSGIREVFFGSYRIIYRVKEELAEILTVYHGSRLLDPSKLTYD